MPAYSAIPILKRLAGTSALVSLNSVLQRWGREFFWVCGGQVVAAAGCIAGVRLLTEVMPPAAYGHFMLAMTLVTLVQQVLASPLSVAVQRFLATAIEEHSYAEYHAAAATLLTLSIGCLAAFIALAALTLGALGKGDVAVLIAISGFFAGLLTISSAMDGMLNAARRRVVVAWHQAATQWMRWLAAAAAVVWLGSSATVAMLGGSIALAILCATRWLALRSWQRQSSMLNIGAGNFASPDHAPQMWFVRLRDYGLPFALWGSFTWATAAADRWALAGFTDSEHVGTYAVLYQLGFFPCVLIADSLQQLVAPILFARSGMGNNIERRRAARRMNDKLMIVLAAILLVMFAVTCLFHRPLLSWLAGAAYRSHSHLLPWVTLAGGLFALGQLAALNIVSGATARPLLPVKIGSALIGIAVNVTGAMLLGIEGVVAAGVIASGIYLGWTLRVSRHEFTGTAPAMVAA